MSRDEFSVHVVEVCRTCSWNHLVQSYVMGAVPVPKARRERSLRSDRSGRAASSSKTETPNRRAATD
jgi:hypothetical protein